MSYGIFWGNPEPYAPMRHSGVLAHRLLWLIVNGQIPKDHLHHVCSVPLCVRPDHLTPLSIVEHQRVHHVEEKCSKGHEWTPENTYYRSNGKRQCRACKAAIQRRSYAGLTSDQKAAMHERSNERRRQRKAARLDERTMT